MLLKTNISSIQVYSDEWYVNRLGKLTASKISTICGEKGLGVGGTNYIRDKVGEELTGETSEKPFDNDYVRHGILYETEAVNKFGLVKGLNFVVVQQLVFAPDSRFACTPDALILLSETPDKTGYNVETVEVKCLPTFSAYISLFECETPEQVKRVEPKYYWQVLEQMNICGATRGYLVCYHPAFRSGNMKIIKFKLNEPERDKQEKVFYPLNEDMKTLKLRETLALEKFNEIRTKLIKAGKV